jgi:16S rRNA (guanine966-N2)-methyltransferase
VARKRPKVRTPRPEGAPAAGGSRKPPRQAKPAAVELRIVGGSWRGSKLIYNGDPGTRPMKDRTREAIFNLIGPAIKGMHALDLFAGTGALGLEALSRGALRATFFERNLPTVRTLKDNIARLNAAEQTEILFGNTFFHAEKFTFATDFPSVAFISPPYDFFVERTEEMLRLISLCCERAPPGSMVIVEADQRFDAATLPEPEQWDTRTYRPAVVSVRRL